MILKLSLNFIPTYSTKNKKKASVLEGDMIFFGVKQNMKKGNYDKQRTITEY